MPAVTTCCSFAALNSVLRSGTKRVCEVVGDSLAYVQIIVFNSQKQRLIVCTDVLPTFLLKCLDILFSLRKYKYPA
jgi:hypothetical protein